MSTPRAASASKQNTYQDSVPPHELVTVEGIDTFLISIAGFKKEEITVQYDKSGMVIVSGKRLLTGGGNQWSRFRKELQVPDDCDVNQIRAVLENGILYVSLPKMKGASRDEPAKNARRPQAPMPRDRTATHHHHKTTEAEAEEEKKKKKKKNGIQDSHHKKCEGLPAWGLVFGYKRREVILSALAAAFAVLLMLALGLYVNYHKQTGH